MHQSQRLQLAQDLTAGRVKIQDLSEAEQIAAFGSVFYRSDLQKGEAEGHPFRGNQYTEGSSVRINADQHPLHGRTGRVKRVIPDAGIGGYTPEGKLKTGYEVSVPGIDGDTDIFGEGELEAEGASNEGSSSAQALFDQQNVGGRDSHNSNTPYNTSAGEKAEQGVFLPDGSKNPEYGKPLTAQEQALGMTEAEFNHLDEQGMMNPWGPSKEGQAELKRLREGKTQGYSAAGQQRQDRRAKIESQNPGKTVEQVLGDKVKAQQNHIANTTVELADSEMTQMALEHLQDNNFKVTRRGSKLYFDNPEDQNAAIESLRGLGIKSGLDSQRAPLPKAQRMDTAEEIRAATAADRRAQRGPNWKTKLKADAERASRR